MRLRQSYKQKELLLFILAAVTLILIKHSLVVSLPVEARYYPTDDFLMVQMAESLLQGTWLGAYSPVNLMKGCFFPLFLAGAARFGSSYLSVLDLTNTLAILFFVSQIRYLFRSRWALFVLFVVLLFEPCTYSNMTFQRVYRSSVTEMQVLFLFGSYFGFFLLTKERKDSGDWGNLWREGTLGLVAGTTLWAIWNTREESMWIIPFVSVASILILIDLIGALRVQKHALKLIGIRIFCCLLPFLILFGGNQWIRWQNERHYGVALRLEEVDGEFADTVKTIYSIKNEVDLPHVTVSREKLERLYAASETLRMIRPELDAQMERYSQADRNRSDREVEDGWFFWGLKRAAFENGAADTLLKSQLFWKQIRLELEDALNTPGSGLERQNTMPSVLMSPWRHSYLSELPDAVRKIVCYMVSYKENAPLIKASGKASNSVSRRFEIRTNNLVVYQDEENEVQQQLLEQKAAVLNWIINIYRTINPFVEVIGFSLYFVFLAICIIKRKKQLISLLLITGGMFLSATVMIIGTAYVHISAFPSVKYFYLVGAYPLMITSEWIVVLCFAEHNLMPCRSYAKKPRVFHTHKL